MPVNIFLRCAYFRHAVEFAGSMAATICAVYDKAVIIIPVLVMARKHLHGRLSCVDTKCVNPTNIMQSKQFVVRVFCAHSHRV